MPKGGPVVQEFYEQALHIVDVYRTSDFSFDDQQQEIDREIEKALGILTKLGLGDYFTSHDIFSFFNSMDAFDLIDDITAGDLLYRIDQDILVSPFNYEFWFRLGNIYGFSSKFELGNCTALRFDDLPDDVRKGFSNVLEYKMKTGKAEHNKKPVEGGWYLHVAVKSIGQEKARQKAVIDFMISYSLTDKTVLTVLVIEDANNPLTSIFPAFLDISPYLAGSSWMIFLAVWKGAFRRLWTLNGLDHDLFKVMAIMRGSPTRLVILKNLHIPKNRLQLAKDLGMHWESINGHVGTLSRYQLISEFAHVGVAQYLIITEKGKRVVELLESKQTDPSSFSAHQ